MSYRDRDDFAKQTGDTLRTIRGMVRRLAVKLTDGVFWQLRGQRGGGGGDEVIHLELFPGIGFYSRPPSSGGTPEAIAVAIAGAAKSRVIVGTRDWKTLQTIQAALPGGKLGENETVIYCGSVFIHLRSNGTVVIRAPGGATPGAVATLKDLQELRDWVADHTHASNGDPPDPPTPPNPSGTTVLKAQ